MKINVLNGELEQKEIDSYVAYLEGKFPDKELESLDLTVDGDYVDLNYEFSKTEPFERIRRITGYLVGTVDRFNNAKRAEEHDRVKHDIACSCTEF